MEDRRVRKTKRAIREAMIRLMRYKPISDITVTELTREADLDRRTFYLHYDNLYDIIEEIEQEAIERLDAAIHDSKYDSMDFFTAMTDIMLTNMDYYDIIISNRTYYVLEHDCKMILKRGMTEYFRARSPLDDITFDYYLEYVASGIINIYTHWIRSGKNLPPDQLTELVRAAVKESWSKLTTGTLDEQDYLLGQPNRE